MIGGVNMKMNNKGQALVEYLLIIAVISVVIISIVKLFLIYMILLFLFVIITSIFSSIKKV